jgi:hypothetical protein
MPSKAVRDLQDLCGVKPDPSPRVPEEKPKLAPRIEKMVECEDYCCARCMFKGTKMAVTEHLRSCRVEPMALNPTLNPVELTVSGEITDTGGWAESCARDKARAEARRFDPYEALDTILGEIDRIRGESPLSGAAVVRERVYALRAYITGMEK